MTAVLLHLQKPHASIAKLEFLQLIESNLDLEIPEKELHDDYELWNLHRLAAYFLLLSEQYQIYSSDDSFRDLQSTID